MWLPGGKVGGVIFGLPVDALLPWPGRRRRVARRGGGDVPG